LTSQYVFVFIETIKKETPLSQSAKQRSSEATELEIAPPKEEKIAVNFCCHHFAVSTYRL